MFNREQWLQDVDAEISRLLQIKQLLLGRPTTNITTERVIPIVGGAKVKKPMSAAERKKRSDAQKARWAERRAAAGQSGSASAKKSPSRK